MWLSKKKKEKCVSINPGSDIAKEVDYQSDLLHRILDAITLTRNVDVYSISPGTKIEKEIMRQTEVLERIAKELAVLSSTVSKMKSSPEGKYTIKIGEKIKKQE